MPIVEDIVHLKDVHSTRISFSVPLDHFKNDDSKSDKSITVCGVLTQKYRKELSLIKVGTANENEKILPNEAKVIVYLQGGPGFPCQMPGKNDTITNFLIGKGYQIFYLDQRGTGYSTAIDAEDLSKFNSVESAAEYLLHFRADSIIEDCEVIRNLLGLKKWSLLGQSYGGFCIFTYLSTHPESISEALITGGIPPVSRHPDDVYSATYKRTTERNIHYYRKYPQDIERVHRIADYLASNKVVLPDGGRLTVERFQTIGLSFGAFGGTDSIHKLVTKLNYDLENRGSFCFSTLNEVQSFYSFDTNPIYFLFQEAIYQDGYETATAWNADRLRYLQENRRYVYSKTNFKLEGGHDIKNALFFTGEMVYKSMFEDYSQLRHVKEVANWLHSNTEWSRLYDVDVLSGLTWDKVKIVAATYVYDQYVDFDVSMKTKEEVFQGNGNLRQYVTSEYFHNGLRADPEKVLGSLFDLLDEELD